MHKVVNDSWSEAKGVLIIEIFVNIVMDYQLSFNRSLHIFLLGNGFKL